MFKKRILFSLGSVLSMCLICSFMLQSRKQTIWMIGDSTMSVKAPDKFPETGWGVAFATKFKTHTEVQNRAKNGGSTKSCINEGIWKEVYEGIQPGDYVFIQFGHNDEKIHKPNTGTTIDEYKANLSFFVEKARSKKAKPVLLTPIARRAFEDGKLIDTHGAYPNAVRDVADSLNVPLIDLTKKTSNLLTEMGEEESMSLFLHLPDGHTNYPKGVIDNTHLNERGAEVIAHLVVQDIRRQGMSLVKYLK